MKKVTIQDIAAEMGLSRNTVAKALNGGLVSPQTRHAVVQKAWQMGYTKLDENLVEEVKTTDRKANTMFRSCSGQGFWLASATPSMMKATGCSSMSSMKRTGTARRQAG